LGDLAPDFVAETTLGEVRFLEWKRDRRALLVSHPGDFTPVCTTELAALAVLAPEFQQRDTLVMAVSLDPLETHYHWRDEIERLAGVPVPFPIAADPNGWIAGLYGMVHPACGPDAVRSAYVIGPDDRVEAMLAYPGCTGRDFRELLRVIDSLRIAKTRGVATPEGWRSGDDVVVPPGMSTEEARALFPKGIEAKRPYLRVTPDPEC
jgi:alkyl hydroperoxide reductase subunit AhpC